MESIIRGVVIYAFLYLIFRIAGKRTLAQTSPFELVLLLIISETTQQAMVDRDQSVTNALLLIVTLVGLSVMLSVIKHHSQTASRWLEGLPVRVTQLAHGLPVGGELDYLDEGTMAQALRARRPVA